MGTYIFYGNVASSRLIVSRLYENAQTSQQEHLQQPRLTRLQFTSLSPEKGLGY